MKNVGDDIDGPVYRELSSYWARYIRNIVLLELLFSDNEYILLLARPVMGGGIFPGFNYS